MRPELTQRLVFALFRGIALLVVAILVGILGYILVKGIGKVASWEFWTAVPTDSLRGGGIFPAIVGTLLLTVLSMAATCTIGIPAGIYLAEYAPKSRLKFIIDVLTNNLAGIPSIVFGLFGMGIFVVVLGFGDSLLAGALTLALMVLPVVIRTTEQAISDVPSGLRQASYGMGATQLQTLRRIVLPVAVPRILTGVILSVGRVAGETAPILFTVAALYLPKLPQSPFDQVMALPYHLYILAVSSPEPDKSLPMAFGTALVLLLLVLVLNLAANAVRRYYANRLKMS